MEPKIARSCAETKQGNTLSFSFNTETNLLIVEIIDMSGAEHNEFVWSYINEKALLKEIRDIGQ